MNPIKTEKPVDPAICRLCGGRQFDTIAEDVGDFEYGTPGLFAFRRCTSCRVVRIDPFPDEAILKAAYPPDYHAYAVPTNAIGRFLKRRYWRRKARQYTRLLPPNATVLDIGCAHGEMIQEMKRAGVENCGGIELNEEAVRHARASGCDVIQGSLESATITPASVDMIIMTNFIEHVPDPEATTKLCHGVLRPGGYVVGETPNVDCWDRRMFGKFWGGYHTPRHFFLFNPSNLKNLGTSAGFSDCRVRNMPQPAHWALSAQNLLHASSIKLSVSAGRSSIYTPLQIAFMPANLMQALISDSTSVEFQFRKL